VDYIEKDELVKVRGRNRLGFLKVTNCVIAMPAAGRRGGRSLPDLPAAGMAKQSPISHEIASGWEEHPALAMTLTHTLLFSRDFENAIEESTADR